MLDVGVDTVVEFVENSWIGIMPDQIRYAGFAK